MTLNFQIGTMCADTHGTTPRRAAQLYKDTALGAVLPDRPIASSDRREQQSSHSHLHTPKRHGVAARAVGPSGRTAFSFKSSETPSECPYGCI
jgi:hypothetical protein